uniref:CBF1-interacting co-repressor CIR N-terminal domain-containing protein n=1 Tax=Strigamia maritima TaxID=126957 RepID=T1IJ04_STRMM
MNILPKKKWHVRTKQNIERVRRDEAKAAEEEKEKQRRIQLAEQETRTDFLRQKVRQSSQSYGSDKAVEEAAANPGHVNLFQAVESGQKSWGTNKEYEAEKREEQETYEKKIGLLTYLGQNSAESQIDKPWYFNPPRRDINKPDDEEEIGIKSKSFLDPLQDLKRQLGPEHFIKSEKSVKQPKIEEKKSKKHKKQKKEKSVTSSGKSLDELRRERLRREREERLKTEKLLAKLKGTDKQEAPKPLDGRQSYNSQFNPHLARQSRKPNPLV